MNARRFHARQRMTWACLAVGVSGPGGRQRTPDVLGRGRQQRTPSRLAARLLLSGAAGRCLCRRRLRSDGAHQTIRHAPGTRRSDHLDLTVHGRLVALSAGSRGIDEGVGRRPHHWRGLPIRRPRRGHRRSAARHEFTQGIPIGSRTHHGWAHRDRGVGRRVPVFGRKRAGRQRRPDAGLGHRHVPHRPWRPSNPPTCPRAAFRGTAKPVGLGSLAALRPGALRLRGREPRSVADESRCATSAGWSRPGYRRAGAPVSPALREPATARRRRRTWRSATR